jgi:hypothetical protein
VTSLSQTAVAIMWEYDARTDAQQGQRTCYLRAAPYLTPAYLRQVQAGFAPQPMPAEFVEHQAYGRVGLVEEPTNDAGPDSATLAHRLWQVTVTPIGRDGWQGTPTTVAVFVTLQRRNHGQPWLISDASAQ